jgi:hypothetical protein
MVRLPRHGHHILIFVVRGIDGRRWARWSSGDGGCWWLVGRGWYTLIAVGWVGSIERLFEFGHLYHLGLRLGAVIRVHKELLYVGSPLLARGGVPYRTAGGLGYIHIIAAS